MKRYWILLISVLLISCNSDHKAESSKKLHTPSFSLGFNIGYLTSSAMCQAIEARIQATMGNCQLANNFAKLARETARKAFTIAINSNTLSLLQSPVRPEIERVLNCKTYGSCIATLMSYKIKCKISNKGRK